MPRSHIDTQRIRRRIRRSLAFALLCAGLLCLLANTTPAQTTGFTYQGAINDGGTAASGNYDLQFTLWDNTSGGNQIGPTQTLNAVAVSNGIFSVTLDFGQNSFPGAQRFLEISTRPAGVSTFTLLSPRQQITSTPYAIRAGSASTADTATTATNSTQLGNVAASQYVLTNDSRLSDARSPSPGSASYIQNTNGQQANSNFNISGNGTAGGALTGITVNALIRYDLNGVRILGNAGANNLFAGISAGSSNSGNGNSFFGSSAGASNTSGSLNSFFGSSAGQANLSGSGNSFFGNNTGFANLGNNNSFFGVSAGRNNSGGFNNSFFGRDAGFNNTNANNNSFFGYTAGFTNSTGNLNSFFGSGAGSSNASGTSNSFFGKDAGRDNNNGTNNSFLGVGAGLNNDSGNDNVFIGLGAGGANTSGNSNSFFGTNAGLGNEVGTNNTTIGSRANVIASNLTNATAIGYRAAVDQNNALVLGSINGINGATADTKVGIGTTTPSERLTIQTATNSYGWVHTQGSITVGSYVGGTNGQPSGGWLGTKSNHPLSFFVNNGGAAMTVETSGFLRLNNVDAGGSLQLCLGNSNHISFCSSSLRYKTNIQPFSGGLSELNRLRPITFDWKEGGAHDLGFGAEDVEKVDPLLVIYNKKGEVEGVKYDRITAVLVNAVKEQQQQIQQQQNQIAAQQQAIQTMQRLINRHLGHQRRVTVHK